MCWQILACLSAAVHTVCFFINLAVTLPQTFLNMQSNEAHPINKPFQEHRHSGDVWSEIQISKIQWNFPANTGSSCYK